MTFEEKLKTLRKQSNLTQEELAKKLYVSRTAVSKWESGKGYPSIDTLKELAKVFGVSTDALLSNDEMLQLSKNEIKDNKKKYANLVIGLLDILAALFLILPIFGKEVDSVISSVMIYYCASSPITYVLYYVFIGLSILNGIATLSLMNFDEKYHKHRIPTSLVLNIILVGVFLLTKQPYPGIAALALLSIKMVIFFKK